MINYIRIQCIAPIVLVLILKGVITSPSQLRDVEPTPLQHLSGTMAIENENPGGYSVLQDMIRLLLTGAVVMNRVNSPRWSGSTIEAVVLAKGQYASVTRRGFKTRQAKEQTVLLAKYLLLYGTKWVCPSNVVYQGQGKNGSSVYLRIKVKGDKPELFCYE